VAGIWSDHLLSYGLGIGRDKFFCRGKKKKVMGAGFTFEEEEKIRWSQPASSNESGRGVHSSRREIKGIRNDESRQQPENQGSPSLLAARGGEALRSASSKTKNMSIKRDAQVNTTLKKKAQPAETSNNIHFGCWGQLLHAKRKGIMAPESDE